MPLRFLLTAVILGVVGPAFAAPPKIETLFPAGGQRGRTVAVTIAGGGEGTLQVWFDRPGITAAADAKEKGKWSFEIAADAVPGPYWLRVFNAEGASSPRPFLVGTLPEAEEAEPNNEPGKSQPIVAPLIINGRLQKSEDVDGYQVHLEQGQTLVAQVDAHRGVGSLMDAALQICSLVERKTTAVDPPQTEAFVLRQNHDTLGLDPRLVFTAPHTGDYLVRLFGFPAEADSSINFAGKESFIYRLTLTAGPCVDYAFPPVLPRTGGRVELVGWNLPDVLKSADVPATTDEDDDAAPTMLAVADAAGLAGLWRTSRPVVLAADDCSAAKPQPITLPVSICGRFRTADDDDAFVFTAAKGDKIKLKLDAHRLGFALDGVLTITDDAGKTLQEVDDAAKDRDPELMFSPPADGKYRVLVRDLFGRGDSRAVYHLSLETVQPTFALSLAADSFVIEGDKPTDAVIAIDRRDGFADEIEFSAEGLPPGVTAAPVVSEAKGDSAKQVKLSLRAEASAVAGGGPIRILGTSKKDPALKRVARFTIVAPAATPSAAWLTVRK